MLEVDEFESAFRSAAKPTFQLMRPAVRTILVVTDLESEDRGRFLAAAERFLAHVAEADAEWVVLGAGMYPSVEALLRAVDSTEPDLLVSYRNLRSDAWRWAYSIGAYLGALARGTPLPLLVTPHPEAHPDLEFADNRLDSVMVVTDHLTGSDALVSWGVKATRPGGRLWLTHVEHDEVFERYMDAISKIPSIPTDEAREAIRKQLLKMPTDYIDSCRAELSELEIPLSIEALVTTGHRVADYRRLVTEHEVDLLVFPTLDEDRIALHGAAHSLAVELLDTPLLMI